MAAIIEGVEGFLDITESLHRIEHSTSVHTSSITCLAVFLRNPEFDCNAEALLDTLWKPRSSDSSFYEEFDMPPFSDTLAT